MDDNRMDVSDDDRIDDVGIDMGITSDSGIKHTADVGQALYNYVVAETQAPNPGHPAIYPASAESWKRLNSAWKDASRSSGSVLENLLFSLHNRLLPLLRYGVKNPAIDEATINGLLNESHEKGTYRPLLNHLASSGAYKCPSLSQPEHQEFVEAYRRKYQGERHKYQGERHKYQGERHKDLLKTLDFYFDTFSHKGNAFSLSTSFVQASCTGKSRTMDEVAKIRITIPFNVREKLDSQNWTYPPPDDEIRDYLLDTPLGDHEAGMARCRAFFKCLFDEALLTLKTFSPTETMPLSLLLYNHLDRNTIEGKLGREQFFTRVVAAANGWYPWVTTDECQSAARTLTDFINKSMHAHQSPGTVALVIVFDEAHTLSKGSATSSWTRITLVESALSWLKTLPIFTVFLSTNSKLESLAPSSDHHPSYRASSGLLVPPLTEFYLFDAHARSVALQLGVDGITLQKLCHPELLTSFGRYQWAAMYQILRDMDEAHRLDFIVNFGIAKLKPSIYSQNSPALRGDEPEYKLACLAIRIMLDINTTMREGFRMASRLVKSHMRIVWSVPQHRQTMDTGSPSELVLVEAAARLLRSDSIDMFHTLNIALSSNPIAKGERGELAARILFIQAQDRTSRHALDYYSMQFLGPVRLLNFLKQLFTSKAYDYIKNALPIEAEPGANRLEDAFKDCWVNFSHFAQARDYGVIKLDTIRQFFFRGIMLQCWDNQHTLDFAAPMVFAKGINERIEDENFSLLGVQVKNRKTSAPNVMHMNAFAAGAKHPILSILLELGEANAPTIIEDDAIVFERQTCVNTRSKDKDKYVLQKQHYQITVHGLAALEMSDIEKGSLERLLSARATFESFPRRDQNLDILKSNLPYYEQSGVTMDWWPKRGDTE